MNILFLSAEVAPFSTVGGLSQVSYFLPRALLKLGHDVRIFSAKYGVIDGSGGSQPVKKKWPMKMEAEGLAVPTSSLPLLCNLKSSRAGLGAVQDLTSGSNDIMAAAEDQMFLRSGGFNLTTSSADNNSIILRSTSGGIQLSTGSASLGEMRLLSSGSLVLDTSLNNSNIRLQAGSGRIDLSGGTILVNSGTGTLTLSSESGVTVGGSLAATGNINSVDGGLQTNSVTRVSNSGAVSASALTMDTSPGKFTFENGFYLQNISPTSLGMYDTGLNLVVTFDEE